MEVEVKEITITIKALTGKDFKVSINNSLSVLDLKKACFEKCKVPAEQQKIIFRGKILKDGDIISKL